MIRIELADIAVDALSGSVLGEPLNGDEVWYCFHTQHDVRVRPSHAALDGTVWRADDPNAPTPPISYGCRCYLTMVAAPGSEAAKTLPVAPSHPIPIATAFANHLDQILPAWTTIAEELKKVPLPNRAETSFQMVTKAAPTMNAAEARDVSRMISVIVNDGAAVAHG